MTHRKEAAVPARMNRELSWLAFNGRVLQEAADPGNPLSGRLRFLAIFSSNLDEFFRVRVASLRSLLRLKKKKLERLGFNPARLLREVHTVVSTQQETFGQIFRGQILPELERQGIFLVNETGLNARQLEHLRSYFQEHVRPLLSPVMLTEGEPPPFLEDRSVHLVVELWPEESIALSAEKPHYALVGVPSPPLDRFVQLPPEAGDRHVVVFLDDVIRCNLPALFPGWDVGGAYAVKLSRDAELHLEDEFGGDIGEAIRKAVAKRDEGPPSRFLYDLQASWALVSYLKEIFDLADEDLVSGGRYHNLHDLDHFPLFGKKGLSWEPDPPLPHPGLEGVDDLLSAVAARDRILHFPYQSYEYVLGFLRQAARDPEVEEIWLTVYRVSPESSVLCAVLEAAERGKKVRVFVEVQARFDEEANLRWAERLEEVGILTTYSIPGFKVHAKAALVVRREKGERRRYAYVGTGNFNERTARYYTDLGLLTAHPGITGDLETVFHYLASDVPEVQEPRFDNMLVAPFTLRDQLHRLIDDEIAAAREGQPAAIAARMNALQDPRVMEHLEEASQAGVAVDLVVRGICCMVPGIPGRSENVRIRSIVDRYLEHGRVWIFHARGEERMFMGSADWMERNLSHRVEVMLPVHDPDIRDQIREMLRLQLADDVKARVVDGTLANRFVPRQAGREPVRAQEASRAYLRGLLFPTASWGNSPTAGRPGAR